MIPVVVKRLVFFVHKNLTLINDFFFVFFELEVLICLYIIKQILLLNKRGGILDMRLLMMEHDEHGIWYFTNMSRAAACICAPVSNVKLMIAGYFHRCKGWKGQWIESDDVLSRYINPTHEKVYGKD